MFKRLSKQLLLYLPAQIVPALLAFISLPLFTRILSAEQYGQYTLVMSTVAIMIILPSWLRMAMIRYYPSVAEDKTTVLLRTSFWAQFTF